MTSKTILWAKLPLTFAILSLAIIDNAKDSSAGIDKPEVIRPSSEYLVLYHEAVDYFKSQHIDIEPGIYVAVRGITNYRKDVLKLIEGGEWDNPFGDKLKIAAGYAPGTRPGTRNEIWAFHDNQYFLLRNNSGESQKIASGIPLHLIPAPGGLFLVTHKRGLLYIDHKIGRTDKAKPFPKASPIENLETTVLSKDGKSLVYFSKTENKPDFLDVNIVSSEGDFQKITEVKNSQRGPEAAITRSGVFHKPSEKELAYIALDPSGKASASKKIYPPASEGLREGQAIAFRDNYAVLQAPNTQNGGRSYFYFRPDGKYDSAERGGIDAARLKPGSKGKLNKYGEDWIQRVEMGHFDDYIDRTIVTDTALNHLKATENTWVNFSGPFGVGKSSLLKLVARSLYGSHRRGEEWTDWGIYHIPLSAIIKLMNAKPPAPKPGEEPPPNPLSELMSAMIGKRVIIMMDNFLDDPVLGATNAGKSMDIFLQLFRQYIVGGKIRIVTTVENDLWEQVIRGNPSILKSVNVVQVREPSPQMVKDILAIELHKLAATYKLQFERDVLDTIMESAAELFPQEVEPLRSIRLAEELARAKGSAAKDARVRFVSRFEARAHFVSVVFDTRSLEGMDINAFEAFLSQRLVGQPFAIDKIVSEIAPLSLGAMDLNRPLGKLFFFGPTGVGKTFSAELIAEGLGLEPVTIDMNFFSGFGPDQPYTKQIKALAGKPYVLILDDIDKHPDGGNLLDQLRSVFETGVYAKGTPEQISLNNAIIVVTGNTGADVVLANPEMSNDDLVAELGKYVSSEAAPDREKISRHVWSRIVDSIAIFKGLTADSLEKISRMFVNELDRDVFNRFKIHVRVTDKLIQNLVSKSTKASLGAIPVKNKIRSELNNRISVHLSKLAGTDSDRFAKVTEILATSTDAGEIRILDDTDPRYPRPVTP